LAAVAAAHPDKVLQVWCEDEAREGQKGRTGHRWFTRGERPPGRCDKRFLSTYLFAAVRPGSDDAFALVLPEAKAATMDLFLARFAETLPTGVHAVLLLDQAGWHGRAALHVPDNVTLLPLPPYSPELNPVERVWLYLRERFLSFRLYRDEQAIVDALCAAWTALRAETGRLTSLTGYPWLMHAVEQVRT
jgi:transposase